MVELGFQGVGVQFCSCDCKPEGKMRVEITAIRDATQVDKAAGMGVPKVQYLPRRYNMDSELTADIAADATKELEIKLSSKLILKTFSLI